MPEHNRPAVTDLHRQYKEHETAWQRICDVLGGADAIKARGELYLPRPQGMDAGSVYPPFKTPTLLEEARTRTVQGLLGLIFRKPPTDNSNGYADVPVVKDKAEYTRPRWQFDAHGFMRSSGNRLLTPEELEGLDQKTIYQLFKKHSLENVYDFRHDVKIAETVDESGWLPTTFMLLQPQTWHPDVLTDVVRMRSLNTTQASKGKDQHLCPLPLDIVERCITQYSMKGEHVLDPFAGLMTVPYVAVKLGRTGTGIELSPPYWTDGAAYCRAAEQEMTMPDLFEALENESEGAA
jgi:hypothetical protein